jgi:DNA-binding transcriptional ArsR family regulator
MDGVPPQSMPARMRTPREALQAALRHSIQAETSGSRKTVHAFDVLGDPVRRRILEILATGEYHACRIFETIHAEFGISQAAVSQHLKVLRGNGFVSVRIDGSRRVYSGTSAPFREVDAWLGRFHAQSEKSLHILTAEIARGKRKTPRLALDAATIFLSSPFPQALLSLVVDQYRSICSAARRAPDSA